MEMKPAGGLPVIHTGQKACYDQRPGWLRTVCVVALILGVLGIIHAGGSLYFFGYGGGISLLFPAPVRQEKVSDRTQIVVVRYSEAQAVAERYREQFAILLAGYLPTALVFDGLRLLISVAMDYGAFHCLRMHSAGKWALEKSILAALLLEAWGVVFGTQLFFAELGLLNEFRDAIANVHRDTPPDLFRFDVLRWGSWAYMIVIYVIVALKVLYYVIALQYLSLRSVRDSFIRKVQPVSLSKT